jgi:hypothetical protein
MKHTEQLQSRPTQGGRSGTLRVVDKPGDKPVSGRKCCGGGSDSGDTKS